MVGTANYNNNLLYKQTKNTHWDHNETRKQLLQYYDTFSYDITEIMRCAVFGCNSDDQAKHFNKGDIKFFRFPTDTTICKDWKIACSRKDDFNTKTSRVCSKHFKKDDYQRNLKYELLKCSVPSNARLIKPDAIPSENLPKQSSSFVIGSSASKRQGRIAKRNQSKLVDTLLKERMNQTVNTRDGGGSSSSSRSSPEHESNINVDDNVVEYTNIVTKDTETNTEVDNRDAIIEELQKKVKLLESKVEASNKLFSSNQMKKILHPERRTRWSIEDVSKAIVIYSAGPRAYRLLLKKGYPYPAVSTLRSRLKNIKILPGILKPVFNIIKLQDMNEMDKVCILSFDEIKLRKVYLYDKANDEILKPSNYAQVFMLRGLFSNWKQPIFYDYDCKITKNLLFKIINYVENSGFRIVGMVSDLGGGNRSSHAELQVSFEQPWFKNPANEHKIYVFADVPHLIKLIRNHFVDSGYIINGKEINKIVVEKLLEVTSESDLSIAHKISKESLNVRNAHRQKVKFATKLFSHTISSAISRCGMNGQLEGNWLECAEFFKLVNDWFDCLNVRVPQPDSRERKHAYGLSLDVQKAIINKMTNVMNNLRAKGKSTLLPFQKGVIMTNRSLQFLFEDLVKRFGIKYILTYRLNQDVLENFFSAIRAKGGLHDHPDPLEFRYRLRSYIMGKNEGSLSAYGNVEEDSTPDLFTVEPTLGEEFFNTILDEEVEMQQDEEPHLVELKDVVYDGLENLAGYICHKLKEPSGSTTSANVSSYSWVDHCSEGGLSKPSTGFMAKIEELEAIFVNVNSDTILISKNYLKNLMDKSRNVQCTENTKKLFFRSRMYFRLRQMNKELTDSFLSRKRKLNKITK